ncbi:MAG: FCD domain-containing protein [Streptosporangiales bacterium]|nr:FCD domain-containing protein [Streptosporangiales bacterium]
MLEQVVFDRRQITDFHMQNRNPPDPHRRTERPERARVRPPSTPAPNGSQRHQSDVRRGGARGGTHDHARRAQRVASVLRGRATATRLLEGTEVRTSDGLVQLLRARRAVEPEAAREAALAADDGLNAALAEIIAEHRGHYAGADDVPRDISLSFHRRVAARTRNPIVKAMLDVVLDPALDRLEAALDVVLASHRSGAAAVAEHQAIADAIAASDADIGERAMRAHLDRLLDEAARFLTEETTPIVERLLTLGLPGSGSPPYPTRDDGPGRRVDVDH